MPEQPTDTLRGLLVGVGGSDSSLTALEHACDIARAARNSLDVLIVEEVLIPSGLALAHGDTLQKFLRDAESASKTIADNVEREVRRIARRRGVGVNIRRLTGRVMECIVEESENASMVIIGKRGYRSDHGGLLGSSTELIVRRTHKPVVVAPGHYRRSRGVTVAYAAKDVGPHSLAIGAALAGLMRIPLEVVTIESDAERCRKVLDQARAEMGRVDIPVSYAGHDGHPVTEIVKRTREDHILVIGAYGHSRLHHMVLGSVTEQVMRLAKGPVLLSAKPIRKPPDSFR